MTDQSAGEPPVWIWKTVRIEHPERADVYDSIRLTGEALYPAGWRPVGAIGSVASGGLYLVFERVAAENFFDAVRADPDLTPEQKATWLAMEPPASLPENKEKES